MVLQGVAAAAGGWSAQLIGLAAGEALFHLSGGIDEGTVAAFQAARGADPAVNPRAAALLAVAPRRIISESDFIFPERRTRDDFYREFLRRVDAPWCLAAALNAGEETRVVCAVNLSRSRGAPSPAQRAVLQALVPHLEAAVSLQLRLNAHTIPIALGALDILEAPAIVCTASGAILAASPLGERALSAGELVRQRQGRLRAACEAADRELRAAITRACAPPSLGRSASSVVALRSGDAVVSGMADVAPFPLGGAAFDAPAKALILLRGRSPARLHAGFHALGFSPAEAGVAHLLLQGSSRAEIAGLRGVSVETVKIQVGALCAKARVRGPAELAARMRELS